MQVGGDVVFLNEKDNCAGVQTAGILVHFTTYDYLVASHFPLLVSFTKA